VYYRPKAQRSKEMHLTCRISSHDLDSKLDSLERMLEEGCRYVLMRTRHDEVCVHED
jgi:translation initiation factor IF-3